MDRGRANHIVAVLVGTVFWVVGLQATRAETTLQEAETALEAGHYAQAEELYKDVIAESENADEILDARKALGVLYICSDRLEDSRVAVSELISACSGHEQLPSAVHELIIACDRQERIEDVLKVFEQVIDSGGCGDDAIWPNMGCVIVHVRRGDRRAYNASFVKLRDHFKDHPRIVEAGMEIADDLRQLNRLLDVKELCRHIVDQWPTRHHAIFSQREVVLCNIAVKEWEMAKDDVDKLLGQYASDPNIGVVLYDIAEAYYTEQRFLEARQLYQYILDQSPQSPKAIESLGGIALSSIGLMDESATLTATQKLLTEFSQDPRFPKTLYRIAKKTENDVRANELYSRIVEASDRDTAALAQAGIGAIRLRAADESGAKEILEDLYTAYSGQTILPQAVIIMADCHYRMGCAAGSRGEQEQAENQLKEACAIFVRIVEQLPETAETTARACFFSGICASQLGQRDTAIKYFKQVYDQWPKSEYAPEALYRVGVAYEKLTHSGEMTRQESLNLIAPSYRLLVQKYPHYKGVKHARYWLDRFDSTSN